MSLRSRSLLRRSCLSVPGSSDRFITKARDIPADMTFLDLEDSVAPSEKVAARATVANAIAAGGWDDRVLCVRVNAWDTTLTFRDILEVVTGAGERLDEIMLPKVQNASQVIATDLLLTQIEAEAGLAPGHIGLEVQIETTTGLINVEEICSASPRVETVVFGPADFAASMEMPVLTGGVEVPEYPGDHFHYVFAKILMAARAAGIQVIDGPYLKIADLEGLRRYALRSAMLGYDGKWAIHPTQVEVLNDVYRPSQELFDKACNLLDAYAAATSNDGRGAVMFGDEMIDEASRKMAMKFRARGEKAKMVRSESTDSQ
jgi:citrate lyase subunit beta/citryl-CoA lyase